MKSRIDIIAHWEERFASAQVDSPRLSAQVLLGHALGLPRLEMLLDARTGVSDNQAAAMEALALRRLHGEPVAYIVGVREFYGLEFHVNPAVLIPRPETELMVDRLLSLGDGENVGRVLDLGTGSGVLAVSCAVHLPRVQVTGVDISADALAVAKRNALAHGVGSRITLVQGDLVDALRIEEFDVILANLPYVPTTMRDGMSHEVLGHEPEHALFAGADGLDVYRRLACALAGRAKPGTLLMCEIDRAQGAAMIALFSGISREVMVERDLAGLDRLVVVVF